MLNLGTVDQFTDLMTVIDPQVLVAGTAVKLGVNKARFFHSMLPLDFGINGDVFDVNGRTITQRVATLGADIDNAVTVITVGASDVVKVGDVLLIGTEKLVVESVSGTNVTVFARGAGGTTPAPHTSGDKINIVSSAIRDADLRNVKSISETTQTLVNYAQLFTEAIDMTKMGKMMKSGGGKINPDDIEQLLIQEALQRLIGVLGWTAINGTKDGSGPRLTSGLLEQLSGGTGFLQTTPLDASGAVFSEDILKGGIELASTYGSPDTILVSPANKEIINGFDLVSSNVDVTRPAGSTQGGRFVETYVYEGVTLNLMVDADMPDTDVVVTPIENCQKAWVRDDVLRVEVEPSLSSRETRKTLQGSMGFGIKNPVEACRIKNIG